MDLLTKIYAVLIGLVIGSFLNVVIYRVPLKISIAKGSSFCQKCNHKLTWLDLFPVFSFIFLGGKCRYCKAKISARYPFVELLNAFCYFFIFQKYGLSYLTILYFVICSCLIVLALIDFDHKIIPDRFHVIIGICAIVIAFLSEDIGWTERIIGLFAISIPLYITALITGGIGEGDVKLFAVCGFLLGWKQIILTMLIASVTAALYGIVLMLMKRAKGKSEIPFGPFIAFAAGICIFWGSGIIDSYVSLF